MGIRGALVPAKAIAATVVSRRLRTLCLHLFDLVSGWSMLNTPRRTSAASSMDSPDSHSP